MRGYVGIGLDNPKYDVNVGSALRAAGCYGAAFVAASGKRWTSAKTDPMKAYRHLPLLRPDDVFDLLPFDCVPVAVDLVEDATPLHEYVHPERAYYIFGDEDATLGDRVLSRCRDKIYIPTNGCMNLAATVNVVLYDRLSKYLTRQELLGMCEEE
jgi:tRNA(Leu) C34 or U34 (ribose-2'-O)-methylase TrmL